MNSSIQTDQLYMSLDWDDDSSAESDSGISSISTDSLSQFDHQDHSFITTVSIIANDISQQSSAYSKALIDFTVSGLTSHDTFIRRSAAVFLWQLFRACNMPCYDSIETKEKMTLLLKFNDGLVDSLETALMADSYSSQMLYWVSGSFHYISRTPLGCDQLLRGNRGLLVSMLSCDLQAVVFYSITTIHNVLLCCSCPFSGPLLTHCVSNILHRVQLCDKVGDTQLKLMAILIDCLSNLAYHNDVIKAQISKNPDTAEVIIITLLCNMSNEKLFLLALRLLKILSTDQVAKRTISNCSAFPTLINAMFRSKWKLNSQIWSLTLWTLRNLSDVLFQEPHLKMYGDVLAQICDKFQQLNALDNDLILQCAAGILANASCDCPKNKKLLVKMKVHDTILLTLSETKDKFQRWSGETLEAMYRCLNHLCSNHEKTLIVIDKCLKTDTRFLQNLSETMFIGNDHLALQAEVPITWNILRAWLGLTRHLCIRQKMVLPFKYPTNQIPFLEMINFNLNKFQIQLEKYILMITPCAMEDSDQPALQYLNQLYSSILHISSIIKSENSDYC